MQTSIVMAMQASSMQRRIEAAARRTSSIVEWPMSGSSFPWSLLQFGWEASTSPGYITIKAGAVIKSVYTPVPIAETLVAIGESPTYVGLQIYRNMTNGAIFTATSEPVSDDTWVKVWFYVFQKLTGGAVELLKLNLGQIMNVDITAYGD